MSAASTSPDPAPETATALPTFRFSLEAQPAKVLPAGSAKEATVAHFPISQRLAGVSMWLEPGAVRELHWHANAAEWGYVLEGSVRVTAYDPQGRVDVAGAGPGDLFYFPRGHGHAIQNAGTTRTHFLLIFDNGSFSEFATFSSTDWLAHTPVEVLTASLGVPAAELTALPKGEAYIVPGPVPGSLADEHPQTPQPLAPLSHTYRFSAQPMIPFSGGEMKIATVAEFPLSTTISGALMVLSPGGLREPHWHPSSAEWFYIVAGSITVTLFGSQGRACTETFVPGDVGYIPMGYGHYLENSGDTPCQIILGFNNGVYEQISLSGWLAANPRQLVASNFNLPLATVDSFPDSSTLFATEPEHS